MYLHPLQNEKIVLSALALAIAVSASAFDPKDLLGKLKGENNDTTATPLTIAVAVSWCSGGLISNAAANKKFTVDDLLGT